MFSGLPIRNKIVRPQACPCGQEMPFSGTDMSRPSIDSAKPFRRVQPGATWTLCPRNPCILSSLREARSGHDMTAQGLHDDSHSAAPHPQRRQGVAERRRVVCAQGLVPRNGAEHEDRDQQKEPGTPGASDVSGDHGGPPDASVELRHSWQRVRSLRTEKTAAEMIGTDSHTVQADVKHVQTCAIPSGR